MRIVLRELKTWPVYTQSGKRLGMIHDCVMDIDEQNIVQYEVKPMRLGRKILLISTAQVISIGNGKIIVHDSVEQQDAVEQSGLAPEVEPLAMRWQGE